MTSMHPAALYACAELKLGLGQPLSAAGSIDCSSVMACSCIMKLIKLSGLDSCLIRQLFKPLQQMAGLCSSPGQRFVLCVRIWMSKWHNCLLHKKPPLWLPAYHYPSDAHLETGEYCRNIIVSHRPADSV